MAKVKVLIDLWFVLHTCLVVPVICLTVLPTCHYFYTESPGLDLILLVI